MLLVVGATGQVGGMVAHTLLAKKEPVRVLVRSGSNTDALKASGADRVAGGLKDPSSLVPVCEGIATVITTASSGSRGGADTPQTVDLDGNRHLVDAARDAGVGQIIFVSTIGASEDSPMELLRAKAKAEVYL